MEYQKSSVNFSNLISIVYFSFSEELQLTDQSSGCTKNVDCEIIHNMHPFIVVHMLTFEAKGSSILHIEMAKWHGGINYKVILWVKLTLIFNRTKHKSVVWFMS
jgi:hypothetical protein